MATENLKNQQAIDKLKELVDRIDIGMMATYPKNDQYIYSVPMSRQEVDEHGNIWFLFSAKCNTHKNLLSDNRISILFAKPSDYTFLTVHGTGEILRDQARIDKYWNPFMEGWFEMGKDDPDIRILKVSVEDANYWDTQSNKMFTFFKMIKNAITNDKMDIGREGSLDI